MKALRILASKDYWSYFWRYWSDSQVARRIVRWSNRITGKRRKLPPDTANGHTLFLWLVFGYPIVRLLVEVAR